MRCVVATFPYLEEKRPGGGVGLGFALFGLDGVGHLLGFGVRHI